MRWGKYSRTHEKYRDSNRNRAAFGTRKPGRVSFPTREESSQESNGDTNSLHLSFKLDFSSAISVARALGLHSEPPRLWSGRLIDLAWNAPLTFCRTLVRILPPLPPLSSSHSPKRISTTLLNLRHDESMANLREREDGRKEEGGVTEQSRNGRMRKCFIIEPGCNETSGNGRVRACYKEQIISPSLSMGYLVNIPR